MTVSYPLPSSDTGVVARDARPGPTEPADAELGARLADIVGDSDLAEAEARRDLAYDLRRARLEQALARERVGIVKVERQERVWVEELEILRKERELVHSVRLPADAECYRSDTLTDAECRRIRRLAEADAEATRLRALAQAEATRVIGLAEAEVIRQKTLAEADGVRARLLAEADGLREMAAATTDARPALVIVQVPAPAAGHLPTAEGVGEDGQAPDSVRPAQAVPPARSSARS
jgi:flotillin